VHKRILQKAILKKNLPIAYIHNKYYLPTPSPAGTGGLVGKGGLGSIFCFWSCFLKSSPAGTGGLVGKGGPGSTFGVWSCFLKSSPAGTGGLVDKGAFKGITLTNKNIAKNRIIFFTTHLHKFWFL
jgi:hypothetical protein